MRLEWEIGQDGSLIIRLVQLDDQGDFTKSQISIPEDVFRAMARRA